MKDVPQKTITASEYQRYKEVAEKIDAGTFYKDARSWYLHKYVFPVTERSFFVVVTIISIITSATAVMVLYKFLPLVRPFPTVVGLQTMAHDIPSIRTIGTKEEDPNYAMMRELSQVFVRGYESYTYEKLGSNQNTVRQFATPALFEEYGGLISIRNPKSPVLKYRQHTQRRITTYPHSFEYAGPAEDPSLEANTHRASLMFDALEENIIGIRKTRWKAEMEFKFSGVHFDKEKREFLPLDFQVTRYNATEVEMPGQPAEAAPAADQGPGETSPEASNSELQVDDNPQAQ